MPNKWSAFPEDAKLRIEEKFALEMEIDTILSSPRVDAAEDRLQDARFLTNQYSASVKREVGPVLESSQTNVSATVVYLHRNAKFSFPQAAAASSGRVMERDAAGAKVRLVESLAEPDQIYLIIELDLVKVQDVTKLIVLSKSGEMEALELEEPEDGLITVVLYKSSRLINIFQDPQSTMVLM